ncbi:hypothetical protein [Microcoleus sp. D2_18a_B4]|uniref:hypothetical protein n=1 Tax=Microcoleus sp. D2_18a_B4 TaxID=3055329 RepID=UPI002FCF470E
MKNSSNTLTGKVSTKKPRGKNGGRIPLPEEEKAETLYVSLPRWLLEAFKKLVPRGIDRSKLIINWVRAYAVAGGESDRLLMQSSVAVEVLGYLEATNAPQELIDKVESAIVARVFDDVRIAEGVTQVGDSFIV